MAGAGQTANFEIAAIADAACIALPADLAIRAPKRGVNALVARVCALEAAGYRGPISFEAFAPSTHADADPSGSLRRSMDFIRAGMARAAA